VAWLRVAAWRKPAVQRDQSVSQRRLNTPGARSISVTASPSRSHGLHHDPAADSAYVTWDARSGCGLAGCIIIISISNGVRPPRSFTALLPEHERGNTSYRWDILGFWHTVSEAQKNGPVKQISKQHLEASWPSRQCIAVNLAKWKLNEN